MKLKKLALIIPGILSLFALASCGKETANYIEDDEEAIEALAYYSYSFDSSEKTVKLKEYLGGSGDVEIPGAIGTYTVTEIGDSCFKGKAITAITIPDTIVTIGDAAFVNNYIEAVVIPDSVISLGEDVFYNPGIVQAKLTSVTIGSGITSIPARTFKGCTALTDVYIPDTITTIETEAFSDCEVLRSLVLPKTIKTIRTQAFEGCDSFKYIYYCGSEDDWQNVFVDDLYNDSFVGAEITYNYER
ncbi:MAG: leucine-rich repeat domain-containing protein [Acholeplasmatales bacterium]|nr:leucine-rich repeat domain-containing protein [Acholeplasmatales bacterium]